MSELREKMDEIAKKYVENKIELSLNECDLVTAVAEMLGENFTPILIPRRTDVDEFILAFGRVPKCPLGRVVSRVDKKIYLQDGLIVKLQTADASRADYLAEFVAEKIYKGYDALESYVAEFEELIKKRGEIDTEKAALKIDYDSLTADIAADLGFIKNADGSFTFVGDSYAYKLATKTASAPCCPSILASGVRIVYDELKTTGEFYKRHLYTDENFFKDAVDLVLDTPLAWKALEQFKFNVREKIK